MARSKRSSRSNVLSKSKKILNNSLKDINYLFRKSSNAVLGLASKGFKTLKTKTKKSRRSRKR